MTEGVGIRDNTNITKIIVYWFQNHVIGKAVWRQRGDIRDVISIGKLVRKNDGPEEVEQILSTMTKYGNAC